jgi:hypothetical protein
VAAKHKGGAERLLLSATGTDPCFLHGVMAGGQDREEMYN